MAHVHLPPCLGYAGEINLLREFNSTFCESDYESAGPEHLVSGHLRGFDLGSLKIFRYDGNGLRRVSRNRQRIRANPVDTFIFALPLNGPIDVMQLGHNTAVTPGHGVLLTTSEPFEVMCGNRTEYDYQELGIRIPGSLLRQYVPWIDDCCASAIQVEQGAGKVLRLLLGSLMDERLNLSTKQADQYGLALLDVLAGLTPAGAASDAVTESASLRGYARTRASAAAFIESNLSNSHLDVALVARHCRVSIRYLYKAFEEAATTVGALIRETRLQRCRSDLLDRSLRHRTLTEIAMRWGFDNSSSFSRGYAARFGAVPSKERRAMLVSARPEASRAARADRHPMRSIDADDDRAAQRHELPRNLEVTG